MAISDKNIRITTNKNKASGFPNIVFTGSSAGTSVLTLEVRDDNTVAFTGLDGDVFSLDYNLSTGTIWSVNDKSGTPFLRASAGGTIGIAELGNNVLLGVGQANPLYKLDVKGWVGFASTGDGSYTILVENGGSVGNNALSLRSANALRFYNSGNTFYTGFIGAQSGVNTTYTLPPTSPAVGTSVLQSTTGGVLTWVAMSSASSSGTVNSGTAGNFAYYASNGTAVSGTSLLSLTGTGISVTGATNSSSTTAGALVVFGGIAITGNAFIGGTVYVPSTTPSNISNLLVSNSTAATSSASGALVVSGGLGVGGAAFIGGTVYVPSTSSSNISNIIFTNGVVTSGSWSSTAITGFYGGTGYNSYTTGDILVGAGNTFVKLGAGTLNYVLTASGANSIPSWQPVSAAASSVQVQGATGTTTIYLTGVNTTTGSGLALTTIAAVSVNPATGYLSATGISSANIFTPGTNINFSDSTNGTGVAYAGGNSRLAINFTTEATTGTAALYNLGGFLTAKNAFFTGTGSSVSILSTVAATNIQNGALSVTGGFALGGAAFIGGTTTHINSTSSSSTNSGSAVFNGGIGIIGNAFIGGTVNLTNTSASGATNTGALVVTGGAAIGQSLSVGGRLQIFNGNNYAAFLFSGTANTTYTLPPASPAATGTSVLSSTISGVMSWVPMAAGGSGSPSGSIGDIQLNGGLGVFATLSSSNLSVSTTTGAFKHIGYNTTGSSNSSTVNAMTIGVEGVSGFVGGAKGTILALDNTSGNAVTYNFIDAQYYNGTNPQKSVFLVDYLGRTTVSDLSIASNKYIGTRFSNTFITSNSQTGSTTYTLPLSSPAVGTSVLQSDLTGIMSWVPMVASSATGAGSGTVAIPGAQYQVAAYYSGVGASVSGSATFVNDLANSRVRITHTTPSTSVSTGAFVVDGSAGVAGSLYIGGQINQTFTPSLGAAIDHAVFLQSNPVQTNVGALIQIGSANKWDGSTAGYFTGTYGGTFIGINAASGNTADFINFQQNGVSVFSVGAGGTVTRFGEQLGYTGTNVLASFVSTVNSYNQLVVQNKSNGTNASADFVLNNDLSTDTTFYGNLGINSSTFSGSGALAAPNATYLSATSGPLVLATTTQHPIRIVMNGGATDMVYFSESGTAISFFTNIELRSQNDVRFWNAGNTNYTSIQASNNSATYTLSLPPAPVGSGASSFVIGADGNIYFVAPGGGIAFSTVTGNLPTIRAKRPLTLQFAAGFTPTAAGVDSLVIRVPDNPSDGTSALTYVPREFYVRVETPSAGSSRIQLERSTGIGAFTLAATGSSYLGGLGLTIAGAGIYVTSTTSFAGAFITSGDNLRLNWTLLNATHANFSVQLLLEEI